MDTHETIKTIDTSIKARVGGADDRRVVGRLMEDLSHNIPSTSMLTSYNNIQNDHVVTAIEINPETNCIISAHAYLNNESEGTISSFRGTKKHLLDECEVLALHSLSLPFISDCFHVL